MIELQVSYFIWHYTRAIRELTGISQNFLWFIYHFFSIGVLSKTLFAPWQRLDEQYKKGFDLGALFGTFILNTLMRILGFFIRSIVIVIGSLVWIIALIFEGVFFFVWLVLPLIILVFIISGLRLLF